MSPDPLLVARLARHGQEHLLKWWGDLGDDERPGSPRSSRGSTSISSTR